MKVIILLCFSLLIYPTLNAKEDDPGMLGGKVYDLEGLYYSEDYKIYEKITEGAGGYHIGRGNKKNQYSTTNIIDRASETDGDLDTRLQAIITAVRGGNVQEKAVFDALVTTLTTPGMWIAGGIQFDADEDDKFGGKTTGTSEWNVDQLTLNLVRRTSWKQDFPKVFANVEAARVFLFGGSTSNVRDLKL